MRYAEQRSDRFKVLEVYYKGTAIGTIPWPYFGGRGNIITQLDKSGVCGLLAVL